LGRAQEIVDLWPDSVLDPGQAKLILVVDKGSQELRIYQPDNQGNLVLVKIVPCSTGQVQGDKLIRGDKKTPEGYYIFRQKLLPSELPDIYGILAYPMDYPNFWDQRVGRGGDGIWTHGVNKPLIDYDSNGCIELLNHDIAALEDVIKLFDTPILVADNLVLAPAEEQKKQAQAISQFLESWRRAWATKDLDRYRRHYDPRFVNSENRSFEGWMEQKKRLASLYKKIVVELEDVRIFRHRDVILVSFIQRYQGDSGFRSVGRKRLYLSQSANGYQILAEEFSNPPGPRPDKRLSPEQKMVALTEPPLAVASVAAPIAMASAGVLAPMGATPRPSGAPAVSGEAASEESARVALEAGLSIPSLSPTSKEEPDEADEPAAGSELGSLVVAENQARENQANNQAVEKPISPADSSTSDSSTSDSSTSQASAATSMTTTSDATSVSTSMAPKSIIAEVGALETAKLPVSLPQEVTFLANQSPTISSEPTPKPKPLIIFKPRFDSPTTAPPEIIAEPKKETFAQSAEDGLKALVVDWLVAWNERDEETYFKFYDRQFQLDKPRMGLVAFKKYRSRLMAQTKILKITGDNLRVEIQGERAKAVFIQNYESDQVKDRGEKTLVFRSSQGQWRIVEEFWLAKP
jgi:murein L,D-transpeptidase YafK